MCGPGLVKPGQGKSWASSCGEAIRSGRDGVLLDPREHVTEPGKRFDTAPFAGSNKGSQDRRRPAERPSHGKDGIERPMPAFSGLLSDSSKWFRISAGHVCKRNYERRALGLIGMIQSAAGNNKGTSSIAADRVLPEGENATS